MPYKPKPKPVKIKQKCRSCGKTLTEHEYFFGYCACRTVGNFQSEPKPKDK